MCKKLIIVCITLTAAAIASAEKITYVDAAHGPTGNTTLANGGGFDLDPNYGAGLTADVSGSDNLWRLREDPTWGNGPTGSVYESGGQYSGSGTDNTEDCPRLKTSISVPDGTYDVYVYFWSDYSQWRVRAGLTNTPTPLMLYYANSIPDSPASPVSPTPSPPLNADDALNFNDPVPMYTAGSRILYQQLLGAVTGTEITVYIDDQTSHGAHNYRTWYDGIGYVPEPATISLLALGGLAILKKRRR